MSWTLNLMVGPNYRPDNVQCLGGLRFGGEISPRPKIPWAKRVGTEESS